LGTFQAVLPLNSIPTGTKRIALVWEWTPTASPAAADETFYVRGVMFMVGEPDFVPLPNFSGRTRPGELLACQAFYEKSNDELVAPGSIGVSQPTGNLTALATPNGQVWPIGSPPKFKVTKRRVPTVSIWDSGGNPNSWNLDVVRASLPILASQTGFHISNDTGGSVTPTLGLSNGQWAADAEI
jgi:hypothetical protein